MEAENFEERKRPSQEAVANPNLNPVSSLHLQYNLSTDSVFRVIGKQTIRRMPIWRRESKVKTSQRPSPKIKNSSSLKR